MKKHHFFDGKSVLTFRNWTKKMSKIENLGYLPRKNYFHCIIEILGLVTKKIIFILLRYFFFIFAENDLGTFSTIII